jgi:FixJ family two-component response regulator
MFAHCAHGVPSAVVQNRNILSVVSEDDTVRSSLGDLFESYQFEVHGYRSLEEFLGTAQPLSGCLILDLPSVHDRSVHTLGLLRTELPQGLSIVLLTGRLDRQARDQVRASGAACQLEKPVDSEWLVATVRALIRNAAVGLIAGREQTAPLFSGGAALHDNRSVCEADR